MVSTTELPFATLYTSLQIPLASHSRLARLGALRLLASPYVSYLASHDASTSPLATNVQDIIQRCMQAEEIPVDVQGVRERVLRIGRLNTVLKDGEEGELAADVVARWLTGMLLLPPYFGPVAFS